MDVVINKEKLNEMLESKQIDDLSNENNKVVCYIRTDPDQTRSCDRQHKALMLFTEKLGLKEPTFIKEVGYGSDENRLKINEILSDSSYKTIIVYSRGVLAKGNYKLIKSALSAQNRNIIVFNEVASLSEIPSKFDDDSYYKNLERDVRKRNNTAINTNTTTIVNSMLFNNF